jgi:hypothetical protein
MTMEPDEEYESEPIHGEGEIDRVDTGIRILLTLVFFLIARVGEAVLVAVIVFELLFTLVTKQPPSLRVRQFANRVIAYLYRTARYLTYNEPRAPFPFQDFPPEVEPPGQPQALGTGA